MSMRVKPNRDKHARYMHEERARIKKHKRAWKRHKKFSPKPYTKLMAARIECHWAFDRLWCGPKRPMSRRLAYLWLQKISGMTQEEAHIAKFDIGLCEAVIDEVKKIYPHLF